MQFKKYKPKGNLVEAAIADAVGGLSDGRRYGPGQAIIRTPATDLRMTADNGAFTHKEISTFEYEVVEAAIFLNDFEEVSEAPEPEAAIEESTEKAEETTETK